MTRLTVIVVLVEVFVILVPMIKEPITDSALLEACLRIVDVRGIMGRACAKQWGAHVQSNGLRMCKAMACAWRWLV